MLSVPPNVAAVLLDIEGTTTPIDFVYTTLFPFARTHLESYLKQEGQTQETQAILAQLEAEYSRETPGQPSLPLWQNTDRLLSATRYLLWLMDQDRKSPALKSLQGKIWQSGYETGQLVGQVFEDVPPFLRGWKAHGRSTCIYSSGSVLAQQLLFRHSNSGDLTPLLDGYFDTAVGPKKEPSSYAAIAQRMGIAAEALLFVSDVVAELAAAESAGLAVALCLRPGNPPVDAAHYPVLSNLLPILDIATR